MGSLDPKGEKSIGVAGFWRGKYLEQMMLASNSWGSLEPSLTEGWTWIHGQVR